ncbi:hypothetical protein BHE74_00057334 [Ensete ventricosum]|nr:hypothetical protein BHE74_00057334 [Ensete ventricosum]
MRGTHGCRSGEEEEEEVTLVDCSRFRGGPTTEKHQGKACVVTISRVGGVAISIEDVMTKEVGECNDEEEGGRRAMGIGNQRRPEAGLLGLEFKREDQRMQRKARAKQQLCHRPHKWREEDEGEGEHADENLLSLDSEKNLLSLDSEKRRGSDIILKYT